MKKIWENKFSLRRFWAIMLKEFIQMRRDKPTLAMMAAIPLLQLILFGFAINTNPKFLPTALVSADNSIFTRTFLKAMENTEYFRFIQPAVDKESADKMMALNQVQFIVSIPANFSRALVRGETPQVLLEVDATDPVSTGNAYVAVSNLINSVFNPDLVGPLQTLQSTPPPVALITHLKYNPLIITQYNIVPGLLGVILTLTMAFITALAMTRERERGTMENLLAMPVRPLEVILGKIAPYVVVGYVQVALILLASHFIFAVPVTGSVLLLLITVLPFIAANLSMGLTFSTLAKNQLQAVQGAMFFFLPSLLLSGFMFPFYGMPTWAQKVGSLLPLTHFLRIARGILLKGNGVIQIWPEVWPILLFTLVVVVIGVKKFRKTLD